MAAKRKSRKRARTESSAAPSRLTDTVHQIWLAGLGAMTKAQQGTPHLLEELIAEGARVDTRVRGAAAETLRGITGSVQQSVGARMSGMRGQAAEAVENLEKLFRSRVRRALTQLGVPSGEDIEALSKRVEMLNANVGRLGDKGASRGRGRGRGRAKRQPPMPPAP